MRRSRCSRKPAGAGRQEPAWSDDIQDVVPGEGITMPNGEPMPEITILGPGPAYDPLRATFNQWISEWARELGMPVKSELTGFNTILGPVFVDAALTCTSWVGAWATWPSPTTSDDFLAQPQRHSHDGQLQHARP